MTMADTQGPDMPEAIAVPRRHWRVQIVWLIPLVALLIGGWLAVRAVMQRGPTITVMFKTAEGLEAGKTKFKYKDVDIGQVTAISVSRDLQHVVVTGELAREIKPHLVDDVRFWVVRPRIAGGSVSGIGTLLGGSYIAVDRGSSNKPRHDFVGLDEPPVIQRDRPGLEYVLHSENAGSLGVGTPVFYRQLKVGEVTQSRLGNDGKTITTSIFIDEPYTKYVNANSRFWNASGIDVRLDASGIKVSTQSLVSILIGGIAFDTPGESVSRIPSAANTEFNLLAKREAAMKNPETESLKFVVVFGESARGLLPGAPVDFRGVEIGEVADVRLDIDPDTHTIVIPVDVSIYPERFRMRSRQERPVMQAAERKKFIDDMVARGLRAQLRTGNLLTGQRYVAIDFFPHVAKARVNWTARPAELPTTPNDLQEIQTALASVAGKLDKLPLQQIGTDLRTTLTTTNTMLQRLDTEVTPEARDALVQARKALGSADRLLSTDQPPQQDVRDTLREFSRAAQSFRVLADYLERHPEALIRGKKGDEK
jgi:paraquat-inducible protein B